MDATSRSTDYLRVHVVINRRAGTALDIDTGQLATAVADAFRKSGHSISVDLVEPKDIEAKLDAALASKPNLIIVGGGDGTVRSAAQRLIHSGIALGILPLGTVNRVARDLKIPIDAQGALNVLINGKIREIDVAQVNDKIFLCNSFLGLPPQICEERQRLRGKPFHVRLKGYLAILGTIIHARHRVHLTIDNEHGSQRIRVLTLAVSNNVSERGQPCISRACRSIKASLASTYPNIAAGWGWYGFSSRRRLGFGAVIPISSIKRRKM